MTEAGGTIKYWVDSSDEYPLYYHENGSLKGTYVRILEALSSQTGLGTEAVDTADGERITASEAVEMLKSGELDLVLGMPLEAAEDGIETTECIYGNYLTALVLPESGMASADDIGSFYWGIDEALLGATEGTAYEGHTLGYNSSEDCYAALEALDVYGILVKRSSLDYSILVNGSSSYLEFEGGRLPYSECIWLNPDNTALNETVKQIALEEKEETEDRLAQYTNLLIEKDNTNTNLTGITCGACALAVMAVILGLVLKAKLAAERSSGKAALATLLDGDPEKELFELNLRTGKIYAYKDFAVLGAAPGSIPNPVTLRELSAILGYDFTAHFADAAKSLSTVYRGRLIIHGGGRKLMLAEDGRRIGRTLYITMTDVT